jgi:hypothetical protein
MISPRLTNPTRKPPTPAPAPVNQTPSNQTAPQANKPSVGKAPVGKLSVPPTTTVAPPAPKAVKPNKPQQFAPAKRAAPPKRKKPGFFRQVLGAIAGEALKGTGMIGKHVVKKITEDAVPVNTCSGAAGLGSEPNDPPVGKKKKAILSYGMFSRKKGKADVSS